MTRRFRVSALILGGALATLVGTATVGAQAPAVPQGKIWTGVWESRNISRLFRAIRDTMPRAAGDEGLNGERRQARPAAVAMLSKLGTRSAAR